MEVSLLEPAPFWGEATVTDVLADSLRRGLPSSAQLALKTMRDDKKT